MIITTSGIYCKSNKCIHKKVWKSEHENMYKIIDIENDKEVILTGIASLIFNCVLSKSEFSISDIADYIDIISTYKKKI